VSKATFGSVLFVQLGGISGCGRDDQPCTWLDPPRPVLDRDRAKVEVVEGAVLLEEDLPLPISVSVPGLTAIHDSERFALRPLLHVLDRAWSRPDN
jgi:hypothetical protein